MSRASTVAAGVLILALAVVGCDSGSTPGPVPTPPTPTSSIATTPHNPSGDLAAVVAAGSKVEFTATYRAVQPAHGSKHPAKHAQWLVWRSSTALRVDVVTGATKATVISTRSAYFSCSADKNNKVCFRAPSVSKAPAALRLDAARLFTTDLADLGQHVDDYTVTSPEDGCFAVRAQPSTPEPRVPRATYCFTKAGIVSEVRYPTGNTVRLLHARVHAPTAAAFKPYASPTPLPR